MDSRKKEGGCRCYGSSSGKNSGGGTGGKAPPKPDQSKPDQPKSDQPKHDQSKPKCPDKPCCPCPCPAEKCNINLASVQQLVDAENKDIELTELLSGITILDERKTKKKILSLYDASNKTIKRSDSTDSDVNPEYLAYIMRSIENGLSMKTDPIEVYEHLFSKGNPNAPLVAVGPAAATEFDQDMVIPLSPPTIIDVMDPDMERGARLEGVVPRVDVGQVEASTLDDVDDLKVLIAGTLKDDNEDSTEDNENKETPRDLLLEGQAPYQSSVSFRGSTPPSWFPGFNVALPDTAHPAVESDPEAILDQAWFHSQPLSLKLEDKGAKLIGS